MITSSLIWAAIVSLALATYDCRRPNQACLNGGTCTYTSSACQCPGTHGGDDCGLDLNKNGTGACSASSCTSGQGICFDDGSNGTACYCGNEYYGDTCNLNRFDLYCGDMNMVIGVNPYNKSRVFSGVGYIDGYLGTSACELKLVTATEPSGPTNWEGYYIQVAHNSTDCGSIPGVVVGSDEYWFSQLSDGSTKYTRVVVVKYSTVFLTSLDDRFTVTCTVQNGTQISAEVQINLDSVTNLNSFSKDKSLGDVYLYIATAGGSIDANGLVNGNIPVNIGDELIFTLGVSGAYTSMHIDEIVATDSTGNASLTILQNSCMTTAASSVIKQDLAPDPSDPKRVFSFKLNAFVFDNDTRVIFKVTFKLCVDANQAECDRVNCSSGDYGYGRKRRDSPEQGEIKGEVRFRYPSYIPDKDDNDIITPVTECTPREKTVLMITMVTGIIFLVIACIVLLVCVIILCRRRRETSQSKTDLYVASKTGVNK